MTLAYIGDSDIVLCGDEIRILDDEGCYWDWGGDQPWTPGPAPRAVTKERANDDGDSDATTHYGPRGYSIEATVYAPDHAALHRAKARIETAIGVRPFKLRVVEPGFDRFATMRRDGEPQWSEQTPTRGRITVGVKAVNPRLYSTEVMTASTGFPTTTGGLSLPASLPTSLDGVTVSGEMSLTSVGNQTAWPIFRIDGPVTDPVIINTTTDQAMRFNLTLAAGEWLTVDTSNHLVLANGDPNAARRSAFYGDWFGLAPASTTTIRFSGATGAGSNLSATWHHTDI